MAPHLIVTMIQNNLNNVTHLNKDSRKKMLNDDEIIHNLQTPKSEITRLVGVFNNNVINCHSLC